VYARPQINSARNSRKNRRGAARARRTHRAQDRDHDGLRPCAGLQRAAKQEEGGRRGPARQRQVDAGGTGAATDRGRSSVRASRITCLRTWRSRVASDAVGGGPGRSSLWPASARSGRSRGVRSVRVSGSHAGAASASPRAGRRASGGPEALRGWWRASGGSRAVVAAVVWRVEQPGAGGRCDLCGVTPRYGKNRTLRADEGVAKNPIVERPLKSGDSRPFRPVSRRGEKL
jgi:hypothetical protein